MASERFLPSGLLQRRQLALLAGWSAAKALGLILLAFALGTWIASLAGSATVNTAHLLGLGVAGALARALGGWGLNVASRRMGLGAKERIRADLVRHATGHTTVLAADDGFSVPLTATLAASGIEKLDDYFTKFIPAMVSAFVIPPLLGVYILTQDLTSAVILVLTIPLVPLFMALIGLHTQEKVAESHNGLDALAHQLYELALGLPALLGLGRARAQGNAIAALGQRYRLATMQNLKTVFLSSFWLELISTLSVAVVAVFIGLRLVGGNLDLSVGLIVLILAPELFAVLREVGSAYHAADDGLAAYQKYIAATADPGPRPLAQLHPEGNLVLQVAELNVAYRDQPALYTGYRLRLHPGERMVLDGPSGSGKSTLLRVIAEATTARGMDPALVSGTVGINGGLAVVQQHPVFSEGTGWAQLRLDAPRAGEDLVAELAQRLGLRELLPRAIAEYSPGQLRRLEVLRAVARIHSDPQVRLLIADEPTAHLDAANAAAVRELLRQLPADCAQLIASHDVLLGATAQVARDTESAVPAAAEGTAPPADDGAHGSRESVAAPAAGGDFTPVRDLLLDHRGSAKALVLGVLSVACAVGLSAVSGWLIVKASYMPPVLHLMVAIVMVRALGIGRAALRYVEQLAIHDAVLGYCAQLRERIWNAMLAQPGQWGIMSRSPVVLRFLLAEVDELRDLLARVIFPPLQALVVWLLGVLVLYLIQPAFGAMALLVMLLILLVVAPLVRRIEGRNLALQLEHRLAVNEQVLALLRNRGALRATGAHATLLERLGRAESANTRRAARHALGQGVGAGLVALLVMLLALMMVAVSQTSAELTAVAALLALALLEPATSALGALQQARGLRELRAALAARGIGAAQDQEPAAEPATGRVRGFEFSALALGYTPDRAVFRDLHGRIEPGRWTAITGPSGSGKSTLLTALLGALPAQAGHLHAIDERGQRRPLDRGALDSVAWCPQEAHLFDSTLERNLALGVAGPVPHAAQLEQVLHQVGLGDWYRRQEHGLQTRIGSGGHGLSGGQRCRLAVARALLADKDVILLDEPTAHLGQDEGSALIDQLRSALAGRTVVLITHDERLAEDCDGRIALGAKPVGVLC